MTKEAGITGLIFADPYFLQALSDHHPDMARELEAIPSINCLLDTPERVFAMLDMIRGTAFKPPSKLVLDRTLNRDMARINEITQQIKAVYPTLRLQLMANEGCLPACPYKPAHDAHMALAVNGICRDRTFALNRDLGCLRRFLASPGLLLASPFIRPEDLRPYATTIDSIKLCGRTKGTPFLMRTIAAYLDGVYNKNILDIMDAMGDLSDQIELPNQALPEDFLARVTTCTKACHACGWCDSMAKTLLTRKEPELHRL